LFGCADIFPLEKMKSKAKKREKWSKEEGEEFGEGNKICDEMVIFLGNFYNALSLFQLNNPRIYI
jgi:hypothetical protein